MDWLDKALLMELYGNSRISFQDLATKFHLTFNAIKYRVKKLEEIGVIQEYTVELSLEMLGLEPLSIGITTDDTEDMKALIDEIGNHRLVRQAIRVGNKYYGASAYATGTKEFFELKQFLESLNGVTNVEIHPVVSIIPDAPPLSKGKSRGQKVTFTKNQLHVLWCLTEDVRMSVGEIAKRVNLTPRRVSKILQDLQEGGGVHFTARINMLALGDVALSLIIHYNEKETIVSQIYDWFKQQYPLELWSFVEWLDEPVVNIALIIEDATKIGEITRAVRAAPFTNSVEDLLVTPQTYAKMHYRDPSQHRLDELFKEAGISVP